MATILPTTKATTETPIAKSDDHHDALAADPTVPQFPQGSTFGNATASTTNTSTSSPTAFGSTPSTGFGSTSSFSSPTSSSFGGGGFGGSSSTGFGGSSGGFGGGSTGFGGGMGSGQMGTPGTANMNVSMSNGPVLTGAGANAAEQADVLVANTNEDWLNKKWRPMMGWMYMAVCTMDFIVFPILWSLLQAHDHGQVTSQWQPVTLQGAGLFHMAMGAVLGIAAYGRTQEKMAGANQTSTSFGK
jgi:hypothetical protein